MGPSSQATRRQAAPPGRADSHWLDVVISSIAMARQEEAFFWPKNNTRVSPGTSLLHPLPSIVNRYTIPGCSALHSLGEGGLAQERLAMWVTPPVIWLHFPGWARVLGAADGQTDQACVSGCQFARGC